MNHKNQLISTSILIAIFLLAVPALTPRVYGAGVANPCGLYGTNQTSRKCGIAILSPGSGGILNNQTNVGSSFVVSFLVHNFTLVQPGQTSDTNTTVGTANNGFNEGHIHVFVDNAYYTLWTSNNGIPLTLSAGQHTVTVELVNDFHQSFSPKIQASTTVTVANSLSTVESTANNAQNYALGALIVSVIAVVLVAYVAFKPKPKTTS